MTLYVDDQLIDARVEAALRYLCRIEDGEVFAYVARGNALVRMRDHELWAFEHDDTLVSARSGEPLAYREGKVFFAADGGAPLYYERAH
jgi:hypothetical protein